MSVPFKPADADGSPPVPAYFDFTPELLAKFPLTELSDALRASIPAILMHWSTEITASIPAARRLPFDQVTDGAPAILEALANALGSTDADVRKQLLIRSPSQGVIRFQQHYEPHDLMFEDRLMRRHVHRHVESTLGRQMTPDEAVALGMGMDLMSQQAVVAYLSHQTSQVRNATESELRYLSFLSHDLNNNLNGVTLWLQVLKTQLQPRADFATEVESINTIQESILRTIGGMGRLLQAERLRHGERKVKLIRVDLRNFVANQTRSFAESAKQRDIQLLVDVPIEASVMTDPDLLTLILQNVIGNAAKFAAPGYVRVRATSAVGSGGRSHWSIAVTDEGPGIAPEQVDRIFRAFERGTMEGSAGVGLGLAIASRAAAMLGGTLSVQSKLGEGSTFTLTFPAT